MEDIIYSRIPRKDLQKLSIYRSSAGLCIRQRTFGYRPNPEDVKSGNNFIDHAVVPKLKEKYARSGKYLQPVYISNKGHKISPDELLTMAWKFNPSELPYMSRDEVEKYTGQELPDSELLKCLHYYISDRVSKSSILQDIERADLEKDDFYNFMDESALLALGKTVETWIDKLIEENDDWKDFMELEEQEQEINDEDAFCEHANSQSNQEGGDKNQEKYDDDSDAYESDSTSSSSSYESADD